MNKFYIFLLILVLILLLWSAFSYFFESSIEEPKYSVIEKREDYEIREYEPYITASVQIEGTYDEVVRNGFNILADYIFGNNTKSEKIDMTAPVLEKSEKIEMTAPVTEKEIEENVRVLSFVMPLKYTLETLPKPNNPDINIKLQESRKVAVMSFSWNRSEERVRLKKEKLMSVLERDNVSVLGIPEYAGYNSPFTPPWLNRNEVMLEIE